MAERSPRPQRVGAPLRNKIDAGLMAASTTDLITKDIEESVLVGFVVPVIWEGYDSLRRMQAKEKRGVGRKLADLFFFTAGAGAVIVLARDIDHLIAEKGGIEDAAHRVVTEIQKGVKIPLGQKRQVEIPSWAIGAAGGAAGGAAIDILKAGEKERTETSLKDAPQEAAVVRAAYDTKRNEKTTINVSAQPVEINGAQVLARDYAAKSLQEMLDQPGLNKQQQSQLQKSIDDVRAIVRGAYDSHNPTPNVQKALELVASDAFEKILLEKELLETAGAITSRPQDAIVTALRDIPAEILKAHDMLLFRWIPLGGVRGILEDLAGEQEFRRGNISLDPRMLINAGRKETLDQVQSALQDKFQEIITEELANDAKGADITLLNSKLSTGLKVSDTAKDAIMNQIVGFVMAEEQPQHASGVAQVTGVLDAFQNRPREVFSEELLAQLPSYQRNHARRRNNRHKAA